MLKAGTYICPHCGHISKLAYYGTGARTLRVILKHTGLLFPDYSLEVVEGTANGADIRLAAPPHRKEQGLPELVNVLINKETEVKLQRFCPSCDKAIPFADYGTVPLYVVGLAGDTFTGKSVWIKALSRNDCLAKLSRENFPYTIDIKTPTATADQPGATAEDGLGNTNYLEISPRGGGKPVAAVLLVDTAGETVKNGNLNSRMSSLLVARDTYSGADALLCFERATVPGENDLGANKAVATCAQMGLLNDIPVACIKTFPDRLLARAPKADGVSEVDQVPLLTRETFQEQSCDPKYYIPRMFLQNSIVRTIGSHVFNGQNRKTSMGFLVQSCQDTPMGDDFTRSMNVLDPLIWVLNALDIFPMIEME